MNNNKKDRIELPFVSETIEKLVKKRYEISKDISNETKYNEIDNGKNSLKSENNILKEIIRNSETLKKSKEIEEILLKTKDKLTTENNNKLKNIIIKTDNLTPEQLEEKIKLIDRIKTFKHSFTRKENIESCVPQVIKDFIANGLKFDINMTFQKSIPNINEKDSLEFIEIENNILKEIIKILKQNNNDEVKQVFEKIENDNKNNTICKDDNTKLKETILSSTDKLKPEDKVVEDKYDLDALIDTIINNTIFNLIDFYKDIKEKNKNGIKKIEINGDIATDLNNYFLYLKNNAKHLYDNLNRLSKTIYKKEECTRDAVNYLLLTIEHIYKDISNKKKEIELSFKIKKDNNREQEIVDKKIEIELKPFLENLKQNLQFILKNGIIINRINKVIKYTLETGDILEDEIVEDLTKDIKLDEIEKYNFKNLLNRILKHKSNFDVNKPNQLTDEEISVINKIAIKFGILPDKTPEKQIESTDKEFRNSLYGKEIIKILYNSKLTIENKKSIMFNVILSKYIEQISCKFDDIKSKKLLNTISEIIDDRNNNISDNNKEKLLSNLIENKIYNGKFIFEKKPYTQVLANIINKIESDYKNNNKNFTIKNAGYEKNIFDVKIKKSDLSKEKLYSFAVKNATNSLVQKNEDEMEKFQNNGINKKILPIENSALSLLFKIFLYSYSNLLVFKKDIKNKTCSFGIAPSAINFLKIFKEKNFKSILDLNIDNNNRALIIKDPKINLFSNNINTVKHTVREFAKFYKNVIKIENKNIITDVIINDKKIIFDEYNIFIDYIKPIIQYIFEYDEKNNKEIKFIKYFYTYGKTQTICNNFKDMCDSFGIENIDIITFKMKFNSIAEMLGAKADDNFDSKFSIISTYLQKIYDFCKQEKITSETFINLMTRPDKIFNNKEREYKLYTKLCNSVFVNNDNIAENTIKNNLERYKSLQEKIIHPYNPTEDDVKILEQENRLSNYNKQCVINSTIMLILNGEPQQKYYTKNIMEKADREDKNKNNIFITGEELNEKFKKFKKSNSKLETPNSINTTYENYISNILNLEYFKKCNNIMKVDLENLKKVLLGEELFIKHSFSSRAGRSHNSVNYLSNFFTPEALVEMALYNITEDDHQNNRMYQLGMINNKIKVVKTLQFDFDFYNYMIPTDHLLKFNIPDRMSILQDEKKYKIVLNKIKQRTAITPKDFCAILKYRVERVNIKDNIVSMEDLEDSMNKVILNNCCLIKALCDASKKKDSEITDKTTENKKISITLGNDIFPCFYKDRIGEKQTVKRLGQENINNFKYTIPKETPKEYREAINELINQTKEFVNFRMNEKNTFYESFKEYINNEKIEESKSNKFETIKDNFTKNKVVVLNNDKGEQEIFVPDDGEYYQKKEDNIFDKLEPGQLDNIPEKYLLENNKINNNENKTYNYNEIKNKLNKIGLYQDELNSRLDKVISIEFNNKKHNILHYAGKYFYKTELTTINKDGKEVPIWASFNENENKKISKLIQDSINKKKEAKEYIEINSTGNSDEKIKIVRYFGIDYYFNSLNNNWEEATHYYNNAIWEERKRIIITKNNDSTKITILNKHSKEEVFSKIFDDWYCFSKNSELKQASKKDVKIIENLTNKNKYTTSIDGKEINLYKIENEIYEETEEKKIVLCDSKRIYDITMNQDKDNIDIIDDDSFEQKKKLSKLCGDWYYYEIKLSNGTYNKFFDKDSPSMVDDNFVKSAKEIPENYKDIITAIDNETKEHITLTNGKEKVIYKTNKNNFYERTKNTLTKCNENTIDSILKNKNNIITIEDYTEKNKKSFSKMFNEWYYCIENGNMKKILKNDEELKNELNEILNIYSTCKDNNNRDVFIHKIGDKLYFSYDKMKLQELNFEKIQSLTTNIEFITQNNQLLCKFKKTDSNKEIFDTKKESLLDDELFNISENSTTVEKNNNKIVENNKTNLFFISNKVYNFNSRKENNHFAPISNKETDKIKLLQTLDVDEKNIKNIEYKNSTENKVLKVKCFKDGSLFAICNNEIKKISPETNIELYTIYNEGILNNKLKTQKIANETVYMIDNIFLIKNKYNTFIQLDNKELLELLKKEKTPLMTSREFPKCIEIENNKHKDFIFEFDNMWLRYNEQNQKFNEIDQKTIDNIKTQIKNNCKIKTITVNGRDLKCIQNIRLSDNYKIDCYIKKDFSSLVIYDKEKYSKNTKSIIDKNIENTKYNIIPKVSQHNLFEENKNKISENQFIHIAKIGNKMMKLTEDDCLKLSNLYLRYLNSSNNLSLNKNTLDKEKSQPNSISDYYSIFKKLNEEYNNNIKNRELPMEQ